MYKTEINKTVMELKAKKNKSAEGQDWFHVISHCKTVCKCAMISESNLSKEIWQNRIESTYLENMQNLLE